MKRRSEPPKAREIVRDEIIGLGSHSLRKSYFGKLQKHVADLARFRELLDVAADAIVVVEIPGYRVVDANRAGRELLDPSGESPGGRPLPSFFSRPVWSRLERFILRPESGAGPPVARAGGRSGRELEIASREHAFGSTRYLVLVARDVTERRRAARALMHAKEEAERVARAKTEFLSIASHELRTPITSLTLRLQQARRVSEGGAAPVEKLLGPVQRLAAILDELIDVSRLERGDMRLSPVRVDLRGLVADVVEDFRTHFAQHRFDLADGPPAFALADASRAAQVVAQFLENAVKFAPPCSAIDVRVWSEPRFARVSVADHGPGIPALERERLFTPFSRVAGTRSVPGLGLGLFVSRQIARMHGGEVVAADTPGGGATLTLTLPVTP
jgi:PAS domain S-box-containing protein